MCATKAAKSQPYSSENHLGMLIEKHFNFHLAAYTCLHLQNCLLGEKKVWKWFEYGNFLVYFLFLKPSIAFEDEKKPVKDKFSGF